VWRGTWSAERGTWHMHIHMMDGGTWHMHMQFRHTHTERGGQEEGVRNPQGQGGGICSFSASLKLLVLVPSPQPQPQPQPHTPCWLPCYAAGVMWGRPHYPSEFGMHIYQILNTCDCRVRRVRHACVCEIAKVCVCVCVRVRLCRCSRSCA
jgi:hypothetical protein